MMMNINWHEWNGVNVKLAGSIWGGSSALAPDAFLLSIIAEYCAPVWSRKSSRCAAELYHLSHFYRHPPFHTSLVAANALQH